MSDPLRAILFKNWDEFKAAQVPGSYCLDLTQGAAQFWFYCPCGCGALCGIRIGKHEKPWPRPSWLWNGSMTDPSLEPSVHQLECNWNGWLKDGYWMPTPDSKAVMARACGPLPEDAAEDAQHAAIRSVVLIGDYNWRKGPFWPSVAAFLFGRRQRFVHIEKRCTVAWWKDRPYLVRMRVA